MKTLTLPPLQAFLHRKNARSKNHDRADLSVSDTKIKQLPKVKQVTWFNPDSTENLSVKEAIIRAAFVIMMPVLSAVDWNYHTHTLFFIVPVIFYLEVTAFTMYCPVKALFSNYSHPPKYE